MSALLGNCFYQVLGVQSSATDNEIKQAFKKLALQLHPDKNLHRTEEAKIEFQALAQACTTLSNPGKRKKYDQHGTANMEGQNTTPYSNGSPPRTPEGNDSDSYDSDSNEYYTQLTIRARVTNKSDVRNYSNARGEGKLFKMDLLDDSGEIRMTGFKNSVDSFYDMVQVNHVYFISWFIVKRANKQYTSIKHDYELSFSGATQVMPCEEDTSDIPEEITYDFVTIADIENVEVGNAIDVIGVFKSVGDCQNPTVSRTGKDVRKRELVLVDQSGKEIALTLWGKRAEEFSDDTHPIVAVKGVQVSDFRGKCLSCLSSAFSQVNPNLEQAHALRRWYDSEGSSSATQSLSSQAPWKLAVEANEVTSSDMEKSEIFMCKVTLMFIQGDNAVYKDNCNKKVVEMGNRIYRCEKCAADIPTFRARLMLRCQFADFTDEFWATCFHETGEAVLNEKSDTLGKFYFDRRDEFDVLVQNALFQQYNGKFKSKMDNITVLELTPINHGKYAKQLLNDISECSS